MELDLLQVFGGFAAGLVAGVILMLIVNKLKSGSASPAGVKQEFEEYKNEVEAHFEATSKKFQNMTEQYQDLYQHLSVGATTLCRPDSVAAALVDGSDPAATPRQLEASAETVSESTEVAEAEEPHATKTSPQQDTADASADNISSENVAKEQSDHASGEEIEEAGQTKSEAAEEANADLKADSASDEPKAPTV